MRWHRTKLCCKFMCRQLTVLNCALRDSDMFYCQMHHLGSRHALKYFSHFYFWFPSVSVWKLDAGMSRSINRHEHARSCQVGLLTEQIVYCVHPQLFGKDLKRWVWTYEPMNVVCVRFLLSLFHFIPMNTTCANAASAFDTISKFLFHEIIIEIAFSNCHTCERNNFAFSTNQLNDTWRWEMKF